MPNKTKAARSSGNYSTPKTTPSRDKQIIADYERGTRIAGWLFCALFLFLAAGSVMFGW